MNSAESEFGDVSTVSGPDEAEKDLFESFAIVGYDFRAVISAMLSLESALVLIVNPAAIFLIATNKVLYKSATNIFMLSASIADCIYGLAMLMNVVTVSMVIADSPVKPTWLSYRAVIVLTILAMAGSFFSNFFISVERAIATFRPLRYKAIVTSKRAIVVTAVTWVYLTILFPILAFVQYRVSSEEERQKVELEYADVFGVAIYRTFIGAHFYVPILSSVVIYIAIARRIFKQSKIMAAATDGGNGKETKVQKKSLKVTKVSMLLLSLLVITMMPAAVVNAILPVPHLTDDNGADYRFRKRGFLLCALPLYAFAFLNIIVYAANHKDFRSVIDLRLRKRSPVASDNDQSMATASTRAVEN